MINLLAAVVFHLPFADDRIELLELNHVYDSCGHLVLSQYIGWDFDDKGDYRCQWWRFQKRFNRPYRDYARGGWVMTGTDADEGVAPRRVRAKVFTESWSFVDHELEHRNVFPQSKRRGLTIRKR